MDIILSYDWIGIVIALIVGLIGYGIFSLGRRAKRKGGKWLLVGVGCIILLVFLALLAGSVYHVFQVVRLAQKYPPPGEIYDVDGVKMHIWAEGTNVADEDGNISPTVIFIPGGYSPGLGLWHIHKAIAKETRSILFDRAGTGWSQRSPYPRHVKRDALELKKLLDAAGERGPFILVGHSWGGFFANNFALNHHDYVAGLVILDGTPPDMIEGPGSQGLAMFANYLKLSSLAKLFSATRFLPSLGGEAEDPDSPDFLYKDLREIFHLYEATEIKAQTGWAAAASFEAMLKNPELQVKDENALGDIPLFAVYRENMNSEMENLSEEEKQKAKAQAMKMMKITEREYEEMMVSLQTSVEKVPKLSKKGVLIYAPEGSTHNFPYEFPDFCVEKIREMITLVMTGESPELETKTEKVDK
jgi:pimeloyl-ACP methyl ester carboxylesterase